MKAKLLKILYLSIFLIPLVYYGYLFAIAENGIIPLAKTPSPIVQASALGVTTGLFSFLTILLMKNKDLQTERKILWFIAFFLLFPVSIIYYWWKYIWPKSKEELFPEPQSPV